MTKESIRHLIADGQLRPAVQDALVYAEKCQIADITNALTILSSNLELQHKQWNTGQISFEEFSRVNARTAQGLTDLLDQLPEVASPAAKTRMLDESRYKWRIFWIFAIAKIIILGRVWYHSGDQGGFSAAEYLSTVTLLGAALAAHTMVMFDNLLQYQSVKRRYIAGSVARMVQILILLYVCGLFLAIELKAMSRLSFPEMNTMITMVETLLGGYVGKVVSRFFKSDK